MVINYDIQKILQVMHDFRNVTGINMLLVKEDFTYIDNGIPNSNDYCEQLQNLMGRDKCVCSDNILLERCRKSKKTEMHICHAGLLEIAVPILYNNIPISYILLGRIRPSLDFSAVEDYIRKLGMDSQIMDELYNELTFLDSHKIKSICNVASVLVSHILTENMLKEEADERIMRVIAFIDQNLDKELTIQTITKGTNISKSVLYKCFSSRFNCTVSEYINIKRVEKSAELLAKTNLSIESISQKSGFLSAAYYSKIFKRLKNTTPTKYRREHQHLSKR